MTRNCSSLVQFVLNCMCCIVGERENKSIHDRNCEGLVIGKTFQETKQKLFTQVLNKTAQFDIAIRIKPFVWMKTYHSNLIQTARDYLQTCHRCWKCHKPLQPIGFDRRNGKYHEDWEGRILHKKCWQEYQNS